MSCQQTCPNLQRKTRGRKVVLAMQHVVRKDGSRASPRLPATFCRRGGPGATWLAGAAAAARPPSFCVWDTPTKGGFWSATCRSGPCRAIRCAGGMPRSLLAQHEGRRRERKWAGKARSQAADNSPITFPTSNLSLLKGAKQSALLGLFRLPLGGGVHPSHF